MPDLILETESLLRKLHRSPRKKMGQHFMVNDAELGFICDALEILPGEPVLEIGPGLGFLTRHLLGKTEVIAVEKDAALASFLQEYFKDKPLTLLPRDILGLDLGKEVRLKEPVKIVGNIPYNITTPILEWLMAQRRLVRRALLTVQREVAQRLAADPGNKAWGALSLFVQVYSDARIIHYIPKDNFWPVPKVDSALIRLDFLDTPRVPPENEDRFFWLVRRAFQKRRKMILNALMDPDQAGFSKVEVSGVLKKAGVEPRRRPETLSLGEWVILSQSF